MQGAPWSTCTGNLQKCWVSKPTALKVVQQDKSCWSSPKSSNPPSATKKKVDSWREKGKSTRKRSVLVPAAPLELMKLIWREKAQKSVSTFPNKRSLLPMNLRSQPLPCCPHWPISWALALCGWRDWYPTSPASPWLQLAPRLWESRCLCQPGLPLSTKRSCCTSKIWSTAAARHWDF